MRLHLLVAASFLLGCSSADAGAGAAPDSSAPAEASPSDANDDAGDAASGQDGATSGGDGGDAGLAPDGFKPRCRGLMNSMTPPPPNTSCTFMDSSVVSVTWAQLQPNAPGDAGAGFDDAAFKPIDDALQRYHVRLRIHGGIFAPDWVKQLVGPPRSFPNSHACDTSGGVEVFDPAANQGGCAPYFWMPPVKAAYDALMAEVARRYESNPNFGEVVDGMCMTVFDEVLYRGHCDKSTVANLTAAGFDFNGANGDLQCQKDALTIHAKRFATTRVSLAVNAWDVISGGGCSTSFAPSTQLVAWAEPLLGQRLVLQHNHLSPGDGCSGDGGGAADSCFISAYQGPHGFQTQAASRLNTPQLVYSTLDNAVSLHANFIELPESCPGAEDVGTLMQYDAKLRAQKP